MIMAVLNPLCCCLSFGNNAEVTTPIAADHSCCAAGAQQDDSSQPSPKEDCPHQMASDWEAIVNTDISTQAVHFVALLDYTTDLLDIATLQNSHAWDSNERLANTTIEKWIHTQTDCVRLL